jgi:predicted AAA+ superfamily ATPase
MWIPRTLDLAQSLQKKSHFLFGPRGIGKTHLINSSLSDAFVIDLLHDDTYSRLLRRPSLIREIIPDSAKIVVVDEIQKIPALLDEIHHLIETQQTRFLLTGSSARKLKRGAANLLGGRAWELSLFPFTTQELGEHFDLHRYLNFGGLPSVYFSEFPKDELRNYVKLYIKEEIQEASLVRRLDHFVRFLDVAAVQNGEELNFESIANDCGVPSRTVAGFFELMQDTLIGFEVPPFSKTKKRKAAKKAKFFLFDLGVAATLARRGNVEEGSELFGRAFEHFMAQEIRAAIAYNNADLPLQYWRSSDRFEVDFVVGEECAVEIKATERVSNKHLVGIQALKEEQLLKHYIVVSRDPVERVSEGIQVLHWKTFLKKLHERHFF